MNDSFLAQISAAKMKFSNSAVLNGTGFALLFALLLPFVAAAAQGQTGANKDGETLYRQRGASCHDTGVSRAPNRVAMAHMSPENVRLALTSGAMSKQATGLSPAQLDSLVRFLVGQATPQQKPAAANACP